MAALATVADLEARLGSVLDAIGYKRAEALLDGASARVRTYTGQQFDTSETTDRLRVSRGIIRLPQRPVAAVDTVADMNGTDITFTWYAGDVVQLGASVGYPVEHPIMAAWYRRYDWVDVTYTHGYAETPADVLEVVCQMVLRAFGSDPSASGITQESVEGYSYSMGTTAAAGAVGMLADERATLDVYRRKGGTIRVGL